MSYPYKPLDSSSEEIRVLLLSPSNKQDIPLHCSLEHRLLSDERSFTALSYVWGDMPDSDLADHVQVICDGHRIAVTWNLWHALQWLRREDQVLHIWVDALCINQSDIEEKEAQILLMRSLYGKAAETYVWIAHFPVFPTEKTHLAFVFLFAWWQNRNSFDALKILELQDSSEVKVEISQALIGLLNSPWFTRVWIVQEVILAQFALICCGDMKVPWEVLCQWVTNIVDSYAIARVLRDPLQVILMKTNGAQLISLWNTTRKHHLRMRLSKTAFGAIFPRYRNSDWTLRLFRTLLFSRNQCATDARDHVYGVLGLTSDELEISYSKPIEEVFTHVAIHSIMQTRTLDVISAALGFGSELLGTSSRRGPKNLVIHSPDLFSRTGRLPGLSAAYEFSRRAMFLGPPPAYAPLPSWVPDWSSNRRYPYFIYLVDDRDEKETFHAALDTRAEVMFFANKTLMVAKGFMFDVVESTHSAKVLDESLLGDIDIERKKVILSIMTLATSVPPNISSAHDGTWLDSHKRDVYWQEDWQVYIKTRKSYFGRVRENVRPGDVICILLGGKIPYVLRPWGDTYKFLGECCELSVCQRENNKLTATPRRWWYHAGRSNGRFRARRCHNGIIYHLVNEQLILTPFYATLRSQEQMQLDNTFR
ncbi:HET-domain-containing protein [Patellaria atrata CBS 101060]|uniref:HET-domain-containing protein n=1 Tax=Patellaria atrata CBS 101060 TaxID=1346257 RepID=A0A9P4VTR3_9PEZI|nr:HET-domain-containing protein [Patellaria atrata CBS 101060]